MTGALVRPVAAVAWELRGAWATGRRVALTIDADVTRVEGIVGEVAATDAYCKVDGVHVPLGRVMAVHRPSRLGDSTADAGEWSGPVPEAAQHDPRQLRLTDA